MHMKFNLRGMVVVPRIFDTSPAVHDSWPSLSWRRGIQNFCFQSNNLLTPGPYPGLGTPLQLITMLYYIFIMHSGRSRNFQRGFQVQEVFNNCDTT